MLKVPFSLPDVEVERALIVKSDAKVLCSALTARRRGLSRNVCWLTAEEIKDFVCSTESLLVVREGFVR